MTVENDIRRNGSGYIDQTAYKAILNAEKGEKNMEYQKGEIYEIKKNDRTTVECVILAVHEETCVILQLSDEIVEGAFKVISKEVKYTSAYRIQYVFKNYIRTFIRKMKDEEFSMVMENVRRSLGIPKIVAAPAPEEKSESARTYDEKICKLETEKKYLCDEIESLKERIEEIESIKEELVSSETECRVYKTLYNSLFKTIESIAMNGLEMKGDK